MMLPTEDIRTFSPLLAGGIDIGRSPLTPMIWLPA